MICFTGRSSIRGLHLRVMGLSVALIFLSSAYLVVKQRIDIMYMMVCSMFYMQNDQRMTQALLNCYALRYGVLGAVAGKYLSRCYSLLGILYTQGPPLSTAHSEQRVAHPAEPSTDFSISLSPVPE